LEGASLENDDDLVRSQSRSDDDAGRGAGSSSPLRVLLVEDDADQRELISAALAPYGFAVVEADNGRDAIDYLMREAEPDVILLDLLMPVVSGWDVLAVLRAYIRLRRIPVIIVTGAPATLQVPHVNVVDRLQKPFRLADLLRLLRRYTDPSNSLH
jgi:two-component system, OmpR family, response regulator CpxR